MSHEKLISCNVALAKLSTHVGLGKASPDLTPVVGASDVVAKP